MQHGRHATGRPRALLLVVGLLVAACGDLQPEDEFSYVTEAEWQKAQKELKDVTTDAGEVADVPVADQVAPLDGGAVVDAGTDVVSDTQEAADVGVDVVVDAGSLDAGSTDGGLLDAGSMDGGSSDAGGQDVGSTDGGAGDAEQVDAGSDAGQPDTKTPDCTIATQAKDCGDSDVCTDDVCKAGVCVHTNNTATCDDGDFCTEKDVCKDGKCLGLAKDVTATCGDGNVCTTETCDGKCLHASASGPCSDGDACTTADKCAASQCVAGEAADCADNDPCTDDSCHKTNGCQHVANSGASCDDGQACTEGDTCKAGQCTGGGPKNCGDDQPCTTDACDSKTGDCKHAPVAGCCVSNDECDDKLECTSDVCKSNQCSNPQVGKDSPCSDGNVCTEKDTCDDGGCVAGKTKDCDDQKACTTDACDKVAGCTHMANTKSCDDGNACTDNDLCKGGQCTAGAAKGCGAALPCRVMICDPKTGQCSSQLADDGTLCADGQAKCEAGVCTRFGAQGRKSVHVPGGNFWMGCNLVNDDECNASDAEKPQHDVVLSAYWLDMYEVTVADYRKCHLAGKCGTPTPSTTASWNNWLVPGREQHPINLVTSPQARAYCQWLGVGHDLPTEAQWEKGARGGCEHNGGAAGCQVGMRTYPWGSTPAPSCDYAVMIGGGSGCGKDATWAVGSKPKGASPYGVHDMAGNAWEWVLDWYDSGYYGKSGKQDPVNLEVSSFVTIRGGSWAHGAKELRSGNRDDHKPSAADPVLGFRCAKSFAYCDDNDPCTKDSEDEGGNCKHAPAADGLACDDGNSCTGVDTCKGGKCAAGAAKVCNDGTVCTNDSCDMDKGCQFVNNIANCSDEDACTANDKCVAGVCKADPPKTCPAPLPCHVATCDAKTGQCGMKVAADGTVCAYNQGKCEAGVCTQVAAQGRKMVNVPAGSFWMGCNAGVDSACGSKSDENPQHEVELSGYWLDMYEVTVADYAKCHSAGTCSAPVTGEGFNWEVSGREKHPVNGVKWPQARAYCKWLGAGYDLLTEAQWEKGARGGCEHNGGAAGCKAQMRTYPWGNTPAPTCDYAALDSGGKGCGAGSTSPVGAKPKGASPYGAHDMAGNISEYVQDFHDAAYYGKSPKKDPVNYLTGSLRVQRGGNWSAVGVALRSGVRDALAAGQANSVSGFRCGRAFDVCDDNDACTADSHDQGGNCQHAPVKDDSACWDGNPCTEGDACQSGKCVAGKAKVCAEPLPCQAVACDGKTGQCVANPAADGTACAEGVGKCETGHCVQVAAQGHKMVHVPAGSFWMGCNADKYGDCKFYPYEGPQHEVHLTQFWLDTYEVTVADYAKCLSAGKCSTPSTKLPTCNWGAVGREKHPINCVDWTQARAYCKWLGPDYGLPTEAQWEKAARGGCVYNGGAAGCQTGMRSYPWGEQTPSCEYAVFDSGGKGCGQSTTAAVGSKPKGVSPYGAHDMAGNVWEWVEDWFEKHYYDKSPKNDPVNDQGSFSHRAFRGGSFLLSPAYLRSSFRDTGIPYSSSGLGFRCVKK